MLKTPKRANVVLVEMLFAEIFEAVSRPVLRVAVLRNGGTTDMPVGNPVNCDPSPMNLP